MQSASIDLPVNMIENHIRDQCTLPNYFVLNKIQFNNQLTLINQEVR